MDGASKFNGKWCRAGMCKWEDNIRKDINGTDLSGSEHGLLVCFCGHLNEFWGAIRAEVFINYPRYCHLLKGDSTP
jgi:hypothetical protein